MTDKPTPTTDLLKRCAEIHEWRSTGVLSGEALRDYAKRKWPDLHDTLQMAEHETVTEALALLAKWGQSAQAGEAVALDHIAVIEDGELRYMTGRKAPAYDCELYAMPDGKRAPVLFTAPQPVAREPQWSPASTPPKESDGEVLVRMADGRCEIAWATYWHGSSNAFAQWTFRDPDEEETPVEWMLIPHGIKGGQHVS